MSNLDKNPGKDKKVLTTHQYNTRRRPVDVIFDKLSDNPSTSEQEVTEDLSRELEDSVISVDSDEGNATIIEKGATADFISKTFDAIVKGIVETNESEIKPLEFTAREFSTSTPRNSCGGISGRPSNTETITSGSIATRGENITKQDNNNQLLRNNQIMASTTISEAFDTLKEDTRTPKFLAPDIFDPCKDNAYTFIKGYERSADINNWKEHHKICYLQNYLSGVAINWYKDYKRANQNKKWDDVKNEFMKEYGNPNYYREIRFKLMNRKQRVDEDIKIYFYNILDLCNQLNPVPNTETILDYFESGLNSSYLTQYNLLTKPNMTLEDLKSVVNKLSDIKNRAVAAHMADPLVSTSVSNCNVVRKSNQPNRQFYSNNSERTQQGKPRCRICQKIGHLSYVCFNNPNRNNASNSRYGTNANHYRQNVHQNQNNRTTQNNRQQGSNGNRNNTHGNYASNESGFNRNYNRDNNTHNRPNNRQ